MAMIPKKRKRKHSEGDRETQKYPEVPLDQLQMNALRKYKKFFKIQTRQCLQKPALGEIILKHFKTMPVCEKEAVAFFIYMVKMNKNKLDHKDSSGTSSGLNPASGSSSNNTESKDIKPSMDRKL